MGVDIGCSLICDFRDCGLGTHILHRQAPLILQAAKSCENEAHCLNQGGMVAVFSNEGVGRPNALGRLCNSFDVNL